MNKKGIVLSPPFVPIYTGGQKIRHLVDSLPPEQREVVILRHYADMSFKEISQLTRVSINTALGRMRYALINIRKMVEEKEIILQ